MFAEEFKNKNIFVTGHTGFKGSWFISILKLFEANVKGYSLSPKYENGIFNLIKSEKLCDSFIGDINDFKTLNSQIISHKPEFVFHFAAQPLVRESYLKPVETYQTNVIGTANVLESVRNLKNDCSVIIITTDKVYENVEKMYSYKETDRLGGFDPYSSSKACVELLVNSYRNSFYENKNSFEKYIATARAGNVIGGGDRSNDRLIPDIIKAKENDEILVVRNPNSVRPWQHVLEPLFGYLDLAINLKKDKLFSSSWNFGPNTGDNLQVKHIVEIAKNHFENLKVDFNQTINNNVLHEANLLMLDISKSLNYLKWKPKWESKKALSLTFDWYEKVKIKKPIDVINNQIHEYLN